MSSFQSLGLTYVPEECVGSISEIPKVTISFFNLTLSLLNGGFSLYEYLKPISASLLSDWR